MRNDAIIKVRDLNSLSGLGDRVLCRGHRQGFHLVFIVGFFVRGCLLDWLDHGKEIGRDRRGDLNPLKVLVMVQSEICVRGASLRKFGVVLP